jgi:TfoX/Sxy family transcriptional regulator of competence genes
MATKATTVAWIVKQISDAGEIKAQKMFGEYGIYLDDKIIGMVCDDQFFVKRTEAGYAFWGEHEEAPPYPRGKPLMVLSEDEMKSKAKLVELLQITYKHLPKQKKIACAK